MNYVFFLRTFTLNTVTLIEDQRNSMQYSIGLLCNFATIIAWVVYMTDILQYPLHLNRIASLYYIEGFDPGA